MLMLINKDLILAPIYYLIAVFIALIFTFLVSLTSLIFLVIVFVFI